MTPPEQLDIFAHSQDVMLRNDVTHALERRDAPAARAAWQALEAAFPDDPALPALDVLATALAQRDSAPLANHDTLARERQTLLHHLAPSARQALGAAAEAWLRPLWHDLAERSALLPFDPSHPDGHAAALWLRGERWADAQRAVESIESWRRIPVPLAWMSEASCRLGRLDNTWPLLAELAWLAPARLDALLRRLDDPLLARLHKKFGMAFEGAGDATDLAWFPAWVLTEAPALAPHLAPALPSQQRPAERGMRLMLELLGLERQGRHHDVVQRRRALRDLQPPLYAAYMATR